MNSTISQSRNSHARNIFLERPPGNKVIEFLIICKNEIGSLAAISNVFAGQNVNIEIAYGHADRRGNQYLLIIYADFSNSTAVVEQTVKELKELMSVRSVEIDTDQTRHFDDFLFPVVGVDSDRAVVMDLNGLIKLEQLMFEKIGSAGHAFLYQMGKDYSAENNKILKSDVFQQDQESLLRNLADLLKAAGWGRFEIRKLAGGFDIVVRGPQLLDGEAFVDSRFFYGMLAGSLQSIFGEELNVIETRYDIHEKTVFLKLRTNTKDYLMRNEKC